MSESNITGKLDSNPDVEERVVREIRAALRALGKSDYLCIYGDDPAGNLALKFENGDRGQTIVIEAHGWPESVNARIVRDLRV